MSEEMQIVAFLALLQATRERYPTLFPESQLREASITFQERSHAIGIGIQVVHREGAFELTALIQIDPPDLNGNTQTALCIRRVVHTDNMNMAIYPGSWHTAWFSPEEIEEERRVQATQREFSPILEA